VGKTTTSETKDFQEIEILTSSVEEELPTTTQQPPITTTTSPPTTTSSTTTSTTSTTSPPPTEPPMISMEVKNIHAFYDGVMATYIVGEVENQNNKNFDFVELKATLYGEDDSVVDVVNGLIDVGAKETVPFKLISLTKKSISKYKVSVTTPNIGTAGPPFSSLFEIKNTNAENDGVMATYITGEVTNKGTKAHEFLEITVVLYNDAGVVIDVANALESVGAGETSAFKIMSLTKEQWSDYKVQVTGGS
jgi:hypothetical protein